MPRRRLYDYYIEDCLSLRFRDMPNPHIPRNRDLEDLLISAGELEFYLQQEISPNNLILFKSSKGNLPNGTEYEIFFRDSRFLYVNAAFALSDILGIKLDKKFKLPLVGLFMSKNAMSLEDAINTLGQKLGNIDDTGSISVKRPCIGFLNVISKMMEYKKNRYNYLKGEMRTGDYIYIKYFDNYKIAIPSFSDSHLIRPSQGIKRNLFNLGFLEKNQDALVILTDSIELACHNQLLANVYFKDIIWLSWYGEKETVENIDWSPLEGRCVYYLLKEHSGFSCETLYDTAETVLAALKDKNLKDLRFVSYLKPDIDSGKKVFISGEFPTVYGPEKFEKEWYNPPMPPRLTFKNEIEFSKRLERKKLMSPFVYENSITVIGAQGQSDITFFTAYLGYFISKGLPAVSGWTTEHVCEVYFLHLENECYNSFEPAFELIKQIAQGAPHSKTLSSLKVCEIIPGPDCFSIIDSIKIRDDKPQLLVINGLYFKDKMEVASFNALLRHLRRLNFTVLVGIDMEQSIKPALNNLMADTRITARRKSPTSNCFMLNTSSRFKGAKKYKWRLDVDSTPPVLEETIDVHKRKHYTEEQREDLKKQIKNYIDDNKKDTDVRKLLKPQIKLSMYKKLKSELAKDGKVSKRKYNKKNPPITTEDKIKIVQ